MSLEAIPFGSVESDSFIKTVHKHYKTYYICTIFGAKKQLNLEEQKTNVSDLPFSLGFHNLYACLSLAEESIVAVVTISK